MTAGSSVQKYERVLLSAEPRKKKEKERELIQPKQHQFKSTSLGRDQVQFILH